MSYKRKSIPAAILAIVGAGVIPSDLPAQEPQKVERIEVTGSNVKRIDAESASPIQIITAEEIQRSGRQTVTELLRELPVNAAGGLTELTGSVSFSQGASSVSLRGLGSSATLVLLNGRRIAPYGLADPNFGQASAVNLNAIPLAAIDRIEILKDGASAIYGSEAIAGVINIILRKDFRGGEMGAQATANKDGKWGAQTVTGTFGLGDPASDRFNVFGSVELYRQESVKFRDVEEFLNRQQFRDVYLTGVASSAYSPYITYITGSRGTTAPSAGSTCPASQTISSVTFLGPAGTMCLYDQWKYVEISPRISRNSIFARGTYDFSATTKAFAEASFVDGNTYFIGPPRTFGQGSAGTFNPSTGRLNVAPTALAVGHPNNPFSVPTLARIRADLVGQNDIEVDSKTSRVVAGFRTLIGSYDFESAVMRNETKQDVTTYNDIRYTPLVRAFAGEHNFLTGTGTITLNDLRINSRDRAKSVFTTVDAKASGDLATLKNGPLAFAAGVEFRREERVANPEPLKLVGEVFSRGVSSADGSRNVASTFAEFVAPAFPSVEIQGAIRYDRYSDYGGSVTPKIAASWVAAPHLKLRASYATGFRAPALTEITRSSTSGFFNNVDDPRRCNRAAGTTVGCGLALPGLIVAFPEIQPEKATTYSAGFIFEPYTDTSVSVDYFSIARRNEITFLSLSEILLNEGSTDPRYANRVVRDPTITSPQVPNDPGAILFVRTGFNNLGETRIRGLDIDARARYSLGAWGKLGISFNATHYIDQRGSGVPNAPLDSFSGFRNSPEWRAQLRTAWEIRDWLFTNSLNYLGPFKPFANPELLTGTSLTAARNCGDVNGTYLGICTVSAYLTADIGTEYRGFRNTRLSLLIRNIANQRPPADPLARPFNFTWYQPQGLNFVANVRYTFK